MHTHTAEVEVTCVELISVIDKNGNKPLTSLPCLHVGATLGRLFNYKFAVGVASRKPFALQGQRCIVRLLTPLNTCMERYDDVPALGRLTLRDVRT